MAMTMRVIMRVTVAVMMAAGQQPGARDIDQEAEDRNRDRFVEADGNGIEQARNGFVADQQGDHRQDDGAAVSREIAELAGAEREIAIVRIFAGVGVSQRRQQQRTGMGRHVQAVGDQGQRAE